MAIASTTLWEIRNGATANNVNGGGFNPGNANFLTNATTDSNTANTSAPVLSSASYNFVAGDVGAWIYIKSGTNWTAGFYKIASVASNKATLNAAIGAAVQFNSTTGEWTPSTVVGCATVGTPTSGTFGIDYSQQTAAVINNTDLACPDGDAAAPTVTSAGSPFGVRLVGNIIHITAGVGYTAGWYEIVSVSGTTATLDRAIGTNGAKSNGTFYVGGGMSMNSTLDQDFLAAAIPSNIYFVVGAITQGEAISLPFTADGTDLLSIKVRGYTTVRGDNPTLASNMPSWNCSTFNFSPGIAWEVRYISFTGTAATVVTFSWQTTMSFCKVVNTSTTANRVALEPSSANGGNVFTFIEAISYRGIAMKGGNSITYCYIHDSNIGISDENAGISSVDISNNIIADNVTSGLHMNRGSLWALTITGNTFYGSGTGASHVGKGFNGATSTSSHMKHYNNLYVAFDEAIDFASVQNAVITNYNNFYLNTTDVTNFYKGPNDLAVDPQFANVGFLSGSTATTSGSVLTQSGGDFSTVTDGVDFVYIVSGTGITAGKYKITSHTSDTITVDIAPGTSAVADKVWRIVTGHDFRIGGNLKAAGFPGLFPAQLTRSYLDIGAVQRQELGVASTWSG